MKIVLPIVGVPNVGKSTLINKLFNKKLSIVTNKPHTTRNLIYYNSSEDVLLIDTPGIEKVKGKLGTVIYDSMQKLIKDYEKLILVVDAFNPQIEKFKEIISKSIVIINKIDYIRKPKILEILNELKELNPIEVFMICAKTGDGISQLKEYLIKNNLLNLKNEIQDNISFFACECVREKILTTINKEIPYKILIYPTEINIPEKGAWEISLNIIVPKKNYKNIIIGKNGSKIKEIGIAARTEIVGKLELNGSLYLNVEVDEKLWNKKEVYEFLGWKI